MKLLLDENLSRRIIPILEPYFPESSQVILLGLERASDLDVWQYAKLHDYIIVTRDADFFDLSILYGAPPKIIWLKNGNSKKEAVANLLISKQAIIHDLFLEKELNCIEIY